MKYHSKLPILAIVATLGSVSQANAGLVNGSFETVDYTGWTLSEDSGNPDYGTWGIIGIGEKIVYDQPTFDWNDGLYVNQNSPGVDPESAPYYPTEGDFLAYQLQKGQETHRMYQDVTLAGGPQTFSWDMSFTNHAVDFDPVNQFLAVQVLDTSDNLLATLFRTNTGDSLSIPMTHFAANFLASPGQTIRFDVTLQAKDPVKYNFDAAFDNFQITLAPPAPAPEPTTLALMGLGLAGLQFSRRKIRARS
jgi:hypothetical protein